MQSWNLYRTKAYLVSVTHHNPSPRAIHTLLPSFLLLKERLELAHGLEELLHEVPGVGGGLRPLRGHVEKDAAVTRHHIGHSIPVV